MPGKLYLIGTPIGNLDDITHRAIDVLSKVDVIACEDTRNSKFLLEKFGIFKKTISHHAFNEKKSANGIIKLLSEGRNVAFISDSGMPVISDPGSLLVDYVRNSNYEVDIIPGPTALTTALSLAGIPAPFIFHGFAPATPKKVRRVLRSYKELQISLIFYESPHKIEKFLNEALKILGDREIVLLRELTKIHQSYYKLKISQMLDLEDENKFRGELVLIILPEQKKSSDDSEDSKLPRLI